MNVNNNWTLFGSSLFRTFTYSALTGEANTHITICRPKYLNIVVHYGSKCWTSNVLRDQKLKEGEI